MARSGGKNVGRPSFKIGKRGKTLVSFVLVSSTPTFLITSSGHLKKEIHYIKKIILKDGWIKI